MKKWKVKIKDTSDFHGGVVPVMHIMTETVEANSREEAKHKIKDGSVHMLYMNPKYKVVSANPIKEK